MSKIQNLKKSAERSAQYRRHNLAPWQKISDKIYRATCKDCEKSVDVNLHPLPNEIAIGGEAVALGCNR
jgi:hypothetical protein